MRDGSEFKFENTDSFPYVQRIATEQGFIQDTNIQFYDAGLSIDIKLREMRQGALLSLRIINSKVLEITESGLPRVNRVSVTSETPLKSTGVYLLAQSDYQQKNNSYRFFGKKFSSQRSTLQVFARVFKIDRKFKGLSDLSITGD